MARQVSRLRDALYKHTMTQLRAQCPDTPEASLLFAVFEMSVHDLIFKSCPHYDYAQAQRFLAGDLTLVSLLGLDVDWVRQRLALLIERCAEYGNEPVRIKRGEGKPPEMVLRREEAAL